MNISEIPEKWVILKLSNNYYKVFATWSGGYLASDRWKINSGIKKVEQDDEFYYFIGFTGSCYKCLKTSYGIANSYSSNILNKILEQSKGKASLLSDNNDWTTIQL